MRFNLAVSDATDTDHIRNQTSFISHRYSTFNTFIHIDSQTNNSINNNKIRINTLQVHSHAN